MRPAASPALRWARASLLAVVTVLVGSVAHVGADGRMPGPVGLSAVLVLCALAAAPFLGRCASRLRVVLLLVVGQTLVHGALSLTAGHLGDVTRSVGSTTGAVPVGGIPRTGSFREQMTHLAPTPTTGAAGADPFGHLVEHVAEQPPLMVLAHLGAAVAVGMWLAVGESALFAVLTLLAAPVLAAGGRVLALAVAVLAVVLGGAASLRLSRRLRGGSRTVVLVQHLTTGVVARRGPPSPRAV